MPNNSTILSNEVQEVISDKLPWLLRYGMILFLLVILGALGASCIIRYPSIIPIDAIIRDEGTPVKAYFAETVVTQSILNRLAVGQKITLRLAAYPVNRPGGIKGVIGSISQVRDSGYRVKILLPQNIEHKKDFFSHGEIVVMDRTLSQAIIGYFLGNKVAE